MAGVTEAMFYGFGAQADRLAAEQQAALGELPKPGEGRDLTGSRIAAIWDRHPFMSRKKLVAHLRGARHPHIDTPSMAAGRALEAEIGLELQRRFPHSEIRVAQTYHRLDSLRLGAKPDFWIGDGVLEVTTTERWEGAAPYYKRVQTFVEAMVSGRGHGLLACMVLPARVLHIYRIERDQEIEEQITQAIKGWWIAFDAGAIPPPSRPVPEIPMVSLGAAS